MRYSLATLMLCVFFAASLMAVWVRREPWYLASVRPYDPDYRRDYPNEINAPHRGSSKSPDGTRSLMTNHWLPPGSHVIAVMDHTSGSKIKAICTISLSTLIASPDFRDDTTIAVLATNKPPDDWNAHEYRTYRRRFPEWWWGHLYRPEVWLSVVLGGVLLARAWRSRQPLGIKS